MNAASTVPLPGPCDYVPLPPMPDHWNVLDVGPGDYPLKRADVYIDRDPEKLRPLKTETKTAIEANLMEGLPGIPDNAFDYVWCSHVLEHVEDPAACARTLSRIAPRGTLVVPSAIKEAIFNFEEQDHRWLVLPDPRNGPPVFVRQNSEYIANLRDNLVQKATCFLYRTGTTHDCTAERHLSQWFRAREVHLDVIVHWEDELKLQVIG